MIYCVWFIRDGIYSVYFPFAECAAGVTVYSADIIVPLLNENRKIKYNTNALIMIFSNSCKLRRNWHGFNVPG